MDINLYLQHNQACLQGPVRSWIYQALGLLWARGGESWWSARFSRRKKEVFSQGLARRLVGVCISVVTAVQQFLGQAWKKDISWLLAGDTGFETRTAYIWAALGESYCL